MSGCQAESPCPPSPEGSPLPTSGASYFVASITDRDYPVLTGVLVFYSVFLVLLNLVVDIAYGFLDPRIRDKR